MIKSTSLWFRIGCSATSAGALAVMAGCATHPKLEPALVTNAPPHREAPPAYAPPAAPVQSSVLPGSIQDFVVNAGDRVYFDYDQFSLRPDALPVLTAQAAWLNRYPGVSVRIEGNCDERGAREYNFALGARRANVVRDFLVGHGVDAARITTVSYGKERPIDPGDDESAWRRNRNAHTDIVAGAR